MLPVMLGWIILPRLAKDGTAIPSGGLES